MRVRILGSAAGGGLPQWNCACPNCRAARAGSIPSRTQSSVAVSADGERWFLINASPDIRQQFEAFAPLHPEATPMRNSRLEGILISNADLDHVAGLLLLREGDPLHLHAAKPVRDYLATPLGFTAILHAFCGIVWHDPPVDQWATLPLMNGEPSGLAYQAISLPSTAPIFAAYGEPEEAQTVAFLIKDQRTEGVLLVAPDVFEITAHIRDAMQSANAILFDGTFWSEDELGGVKATSRIASAMGHLPVKSGSLEVLSRSPARHRIYLHINNTNPMLAAASAERREVENAGIVIGTDGSEFEL